MTDPWPHLDLAAREEDYQHQVQAWRRWIHSRCNGDTIRCPWCEEFEEDANDRSNVRNLKAVGE